MRTVVAADNAAMPPAQTTEPFVVKRRGLGTTKTTLFLGTLLFAAMILFTLLAVVVQLIRGEPIREPLEAVWLSWGGMPLIFAVGLPVLLLLGAITNLEERREADEEDVLLSINETGVYLGGEQPVTIPWSEVRGICRIERHADGGESWEPHLVVLLHDDAALGHDWKTWGPSRPWPGCLEVLGRELPYDDLVAAVARHAPQTPATNRGRLPD